MADPNHIDITLTTAHGGDLAESLNMVAVGTAGIVRVFNVCDAARSTTGGADDTVFEGGTIIGVPAGKGAAFFSALNSLKTGLLAADVSTNLPKLDQGKVPD